MTGIGSTIAVFLTASLAGAQADTVVRMAAAPRHPGVATVAEELSIGTVSGADQYTFGDVFDIAPGWDGSIYVLDRQDMTIRVYDRAGKYLRRFGQRGRGPGDIGTPSGMVVLRDGRVALYDTGNRWISVFSPTGASVAQWPIASVGTALMRLLVLDTTGMLRVRKAAPPAPHAPLTDLTYLWLTVRPTDGAVVDSIMEPTFPSHPAPFRANHPSGRGWRQMAMPYLAPHLVAMSPAGYLATAVPSRYAFEISQPNKPTISVRRNVPAPLVSPKERAAVRNRIQTRMVETDPNWGWGGRDIPTTKPHFDALEIGSDGRIWLRHEASPRPLVTRAGRPARPGAAAQMNIVLPGEDVVEVPTRWDVFEASGAYVGAVELPVRVDPIRMTGDTIWATARDEDDVQFVKRYRVVWK